MTDDEVEVEVRVIRVPRGGTGGRRRWPLALVDGRVWGYESTADEDWTLWSTVRQRLWTRARRDGAPAETVIHTGLAPLEGGRRALRYWQVVRPGAAAHPVFEEGDVVAPGVLVAALTDPMDCPGCGVEVQAGNDGAERLLGDRVLREPGASNDERAWETNEVARRDTDPGYTGDAAPPHAFTGPDPYRGEGLNQADVPDWER